MRSRYTAYSTANVEYIAQTMKSPALDQFDAEDARAWAQSVSWIKLKVVAASMNGDKGFVEFIAYFIDQGKAQTLHEASEFQRINGRWYYLDGKKPVNPGRNDPCLCGSGKKYKKCCGL
jgi:SEC-C motif-containing protein